MSAKQIDVDEAIAKLSDKHEVAEGDLRETYEGLLAEEQDKGVSDPQRRAVRRLSLEYKGSQMSSAQELRGMVLGATDPINTSRSAIRRAKEYANNKGVEAAVKQRLLKKVPTSAPDGLATLTVTGEDGEKTEYAVLDSNSSSPTHGEPVPEEDYIRYAYGVAKRQGDNDYSWFHAVMDADPPEVPDLPPMREAVAFEGTWNEQDNRNTVAVGLRSDFEPAGDGPSGIDMVESLTSVDLADADSSRFNRNDVFLTFGSVAYMELSPDEGQSRRLTLVDPFAFDSDLSRTVWVPDHVDIDFAENSDVYVVGQTSPSNDPEYEDSIEAVGVIPHPDYKVERADVDSMADEDGGESAGTVSESVTDTGEETIEQTAEAAAGEPDTTDPDEDPDAFETDEQAGRPDVVKEAGYTELQSVASGVDAVPGSGIGEDEMREKLVAELGADLLAAQLRKERDEGADADGAPADEPDEADGTDAAAGGESADESQLEAVTDGEGETDDGDEDGWEW